MNATSVRSSWLRGARSDRVMAPRPTVPTTVRGEGTIRDARSVRLPANAGMSTSAGSAKETSSPNVPRRVWMKSRQPCDRLSWSSRSSGPIALTWYGGER